LRAFFCHEEIPLSRIFIIIVCLLFSAFGYAGENADRLYAEADRLWLEKKFDASAAKYREAIEQAPNAMGYTKLGSLMMSQNNTAEAIAAYQEAIQLDAENPKLFMALAIAYLHRSEFSKASAMTEQAMRLDPDMKNARDMQNYLSEKQKRTEAHAEAMQQAHPQTQTPGGNGHN
jgi:tetratricopeptide (TPR) repeat protein